MMATLYVQTTGSLSTHASQFVPIPGLKLTLPEGDASTALLILNLGMPYAEGNNYPGGMFAISVNNKMLAPQASFTYGTQQPGSFNRMPTTLVASAPLLIALQTVQAMWLGVRGSTVMLDSPASLSAAW
jgi:hypothetical protein